MYAQSPIQGPTHRNPSLIYMHVSPVIECEACHLRAQKRLSVWQGHVGLMLASLEAVNTLWSWMRGGMEIGRDTSMWARIYFVCYWEVGWQSISVSNAFSNVTEFWVAPDFGWHPPKFPSCDSTHCIPRSTLCLHTAEVQFCVCLGYACKARVT